MKCFYNLRAFWDGCIYPHHFKQKRFDQYHIQVLQSYRLAVMFVVPLFHAIIIELVTGPMGNEATLTILKKVLDECEVVAKNTKIYVLDGSANKELSSRLKREVDLADEAICHAGNLCNNFVPGQLTKYTHELALRAHDICDAATKRMRFS